MRSIDRRCRPQKQLEPITRLGALLASIALAGCAAYATDDSIAVDRDRADLPADPWQEETSWEDELRAHAEQEIAYHTSVAGPAAPSWSCVGTWAVAGTVVGEVGSKVCIVGGLVTAETGAGLAVAAVCGVVDVVQLDWAIGGLLGSVTGLAACTAEAVFPELSSGFRVFHASPADGAGDGSTVDERRDATALALFDQACGANDKNAASNECSLFFHYTDATRFAAIEAEQMIRPDQRGRIHVTWLPLDPNDVVQDLFLGRSDHQGRGDYMFAISPKQGVFFTPGADPLELYYEAGSLRFGRHVEVVYAGVNPF